MFAWAHRPKVGIPAGEVIARANFLASVLSCGAGMHVIDYARVFRFLARRAGVVRVPSRFGRPEIRTRARETLRRTGSSGRVPRTPNAIGCLDRPQSRSAPQHVGPADHRLRTIVR